MAWISAHQGDDEKKRRRDHFGFRFPSLASPIGAPLSFSEAASLEETSTRITRIVFG